MQIRLAYQKNILKGDLNHLQNFCLQVAMMEEDDLTFEIEEQRMRYTILSNNPELYRKVFQEAIVDEDEEGVEWITPDSAEDIDFILEDYARVQKESVEV